VLPFGSAANLRDADITSSDVHDCIKSLRHSQRILIFHSGKSYASDVLLLSATINTPNMPRSDRKSVSDSGTFRSGPDPK
jgi:hypothetical protein